MNLGSKLLSLFRPDGPDVPRLVYTWLLLRLPLTEAEFREMGSAWVSAELASVLASGEAGADVASRLGWTSSTLGDVEALTELEIFKDFSIGGFLTTLPQVERLRTLPFVNHVHTIPLAEAANYVRIVKSLHDIVQRDVQVVNMSLQPLDVRPFDALEAMNVATKVVSDRGKTIVFAAGNFGAAGNGSMNPWSLAPWVVGVGAADATGKRLWNGSSRGVPGDPQNHPTIVAPGIDIIAATTSNSSIMKPIPGDPLHGTGTGTSFAAAHVSGIAALIHEFVELFSVGAVAEEWAESAKRAEPAGRWDVDTRFETVKRILIDMAVPMPSYGLHEVGAGFVSEPIAQAYFLDFSLTNFVRVFRTG